MIIKTVKQYQVYPLFYAPFYYCQMKREMKVTFIGLNIIFYFIVEFYIAFRSFGHLILRHRAYRENNNEN